MGSVVLFTSVAQAYVWRRQRSGRRWLAEISGFPPRGHEESNLIGWLGMMDAGQKFAGGEPTANVQLSCLAYRATALNGALHAPN
jgi:hypothetical protein